MTSNRIGFFDAKKPFFEFSNYYMNEPIEIDGVAYRSGEHYYQSKKFELDSDYNLIIRNAKTPHQSRLLGQQKINSRYGGNDEVNTMIRRYKHESIDINWDVVKDGVMRTVVYHKFSQSATLRQLLISTGDSYLYENSPYDSYWGVGRNGNGKNMLGKILMEVREILVNGCVSEETNNTYRWIVCKESDSMHLF